MNYYEAKNPNYEKNVNIMRFKVKTFRSKVKMIYQKVNFIR